MSDTPPAALPAGLSGKVISVTDARGQDPAGSWVPGRNVTYQLNSGHTGTVFVALSSFNPESVKAAILADAVKIAGVANITF